VIVIAMVKLTCAVPVVQCHRCPLGKICPLSKEFFSESIEWGTAKEQAYTAMEDVSEKCPLKQVAKI
jgi:hypothetical protein